KLRVALWLNSRRFTIKRRGFLNHVPKGTWGTCLFLGGSLPRCRRKHYCVTMIDRVISTLLLLSLGSLLQVHGQQAEPERQTLARIKASADNGDAGAQLQLGTLYASGMGVSRDIAKAAKWHRKAAEQGLPQA